MPRRRFRAPYDTGYDNEELKDVYALADKHVPKYKRLWLEGIAAVSKEIGRASLYALERYYEVEPVLIAVETDPGVEKAWRALERSLSKQTLLLWTDTEQQTKTVVKQYDVALYDELARKPELTEAAFTYADLQSSALVTKIAEETRTGIRGIVAQGLRDGKHPRIVAKRIRDLGIGLAEKGPHTYARVQRYWEAQIEAGVSEKVAEQRAIRFEQKLIKERAESIAQTEMVRAQGNARRAVWADEKSKGLIDGRAVRVWIAGFERTCEICAGLDGATAPLGEPYPSGDMGPPQHPRCRCTEGLKLA